MSSTLSTDPLRPAPAPARTRRLGELPFFGCHYDIARGAYLKPQALRQVLGLARAAGFNHFLPYLENMIRLGPIAKACPSCAYTPQQWREFEDHAAELGMELVPHFNVIGHTQDICRAYPELAAELGEHEMDPTQPAVGRWLRDCLEEFCGFSRSRHFLIGGDEWQTPRKLLLDPQLDPGLLWVEQINVAVKLLVQRGRVPIVWHDMLLHYPQSLPRLSRDAVVAFWYYDLEPDMPALTLLKRHGFRTLMAAGNCGLWSRRYLNGLNAAAHAVEQHRPDGLMITHWENTRYEHGVINLHLLRQWADGAPLPTAVLTTLTLGEAIAKAPASAAFVPRWRQQLLESLDDSAWSDFAECRDHLRAAARGDRDTLIRGFQKHQYAEGPTLARLKAEAPPPPVAPRAVAPSFSRSLQLDVRQDAEVGSVLRVSDATQSFVLHPRFGAPLHDWWVGGRCVIADALPPDSRMRRTAPGGYRGYNGGFRPIWALGTHHNPNILWQGAYDWAIQHQDAQTLVLRLTRRLPHVQVTYDLSVQRDCPGFAVELTALNHLPHVIAGFNWNLVLAVNDEELDRGEFHWQANGRPMRTSVPAQAIGAFWIDQAADLRWRTPAGEFQIEADPQQTAGYYVDWHWSFITPDLHARYQPLEVGQTLRTRWRFSVTSR